jgi:hypothetical protein
MHNFTVERHCRCYSLLIRLRHLYIRKVQACPRMWSNLLQTAVVLAAEDAKTFSVGAFLIYLVAIMHIAISQAALSYIPGPHYEIGRNSVLLSPSVALFPASNYVARRMIQPSTSGHATVSTIGESCHLYIYHLPSRCFLVRGSVMPFETILNLCKTSKSSLLLYFFSHTNTLAQLFELLVLTGHGFHGRPIRLFQNRFELPACGRVPAGNAPLPPLGSSMGDPEHDSHSCGSATIWTCRG